MSILFGHPTGAPHSHNAALAHFEAGRLDAFVVPWMPTPAELALVRKLPGLQNWSARLQRRSFPPLFDAPKIQGRLAEWTRMAKRILLGNRISSEALAYEANDWLMETMARECARPSVTAVHSYEDCSLLQFQEARKRDKACIYDMPIGYYPAWEETQNQLAREFADWLPDGKLPSRKYVRPEQKRKEMELADLVLVPSSFVEKTVARFHDKRISVASYGVDLEFWKPPEDVESDRPFRFIYVGHSSIRKGTPVLLQAWKNAGLKNAELFLIGPWQLSQKVKSDLPGSVRHFPPMPAPEVRAKYQSSDVFVFPSFFEGFGLVLLEAMACGLPVIATERTAAPDIIDEKTGDLVAAGDVDGLVDALRMTVERGENTIEIKKAARAKACQHSWIKYRQAVTNAVNSIA